jgi:hypothetical protein
MEKKSQFKIVDGSFYTFHVNRHGSKVNFLPCLVSVHYSICPYVYVIPFASSRLKFLIYSFAKTDIEEDYIVVKTEYGVLKIKHEKEFSKISELKKDIEGQEKKDKDKVDAIIGVVNEFLEQVYIDPKLVLTKKERGRLLRVRGIHNFIRSLLINVIENVKQENKCFVSQNAVANKMLNSFSDKLIKLKFVHDLNK